MYLKHTMNIKDISDYIIKTYPDCCLANNIENSHYDEEELIKECEDFFYYEKLNWCGCGDPDAAKKTIRDFLRILYDSCKDEDFDTFYNRKKNNLKERFGVDSIYDNELLLCFAYTMDTAGFTEHGGGIGGAWVTNEGEMFLWLLNQNEELVNS